MTSTDVNERLEKLKNSIEDKLHQAKLLEDALEELQQQEIALLAKKVKLSYHPQLNYQLATLQLDIGKSMSTLLHID
jgi:hypothetical protein